MSLEFCAQNVQWKIKDLFGRLVGFRFMLKPQTEFQMVFLSSVLGSPYSTSIASSEKQLFPSFSYFIFRFFLLFFFLYLQFFFHFRTLFLFLLFFFFFSSFSFWSLWRQAMLTSVGGAFLLTFENISFYLQFFFGSKNIYRFYE